MKNLFKCFLMSVIATTSIFVTAQDIPSVFTYQVGNCKISLLSEAQQAAKTSILIGASENILKECAPEGTFPNAMNAFLIQTPEKAILFDTGMGRKLFENLESLGISPEKVDIICITHMHGDHIGGMLKEDKATFPNAQVYLPRPEHDYWMTQNNPQPKKVIELYKDRLHLFEPGTLSGQTTDILPGIKGIAAYGHTPGHVGFMVESKGEKMFIWGDLTHAMAVQMPYPRIAVTYDVNPQEAISAREEILKYVNQHQIPVAGMHIPFPGMGRIEKRTAGGYTFVPLK